MAISCDHPRPKLNMPGYTPPRFSWQPPAVIPTDASGMARAVLEGFRGVYAVLQQLGQKRTVVPLIEDIDARAGQVIVGVGAGQVIRLPPLAAHELGLVSVILTDVSDPVSIVNPDGSEILLNTPGAYDFVSGEADGNYHTTPGSTAGSLSLLLPGAPVYDVTAGPFFARADGSGDDTARINAAIAAAIARPGRVYLGARHRITGPLTALTNNNIEILGRGNFNGGTVLEADSPPSGQGVVNFGNSRDCALRNVWIAVQDASVDGWGVRVEQATRATVENVLISGVGGGVDVDRSNRVTLLHVRVDNIFGAYVFYMHGSGGTFNHGTRLHACAGSQSYPLGDGPGRGNWATSTAYSVGDIVVANGGLWQCSTAGTSAGAGTGPSGLPSSSLSLVHVTPVVDGTAQWRFAMGAFTGYAHGSFAHTVIMTECGGSRGLYGVWLFDDLGDAPTFCHAWQHTTEDTLSHGIFIEACDGAVMFDQSTVLPVLTSGTSGIAIGPNATRWQFSGGESNTGISIEGTSGVVRGMHTSDITLESTADEVLVENNCLSDDLTVNAGADNYAIVGNFIGGTLTNTPGIASTRVVRSNVPSTEFTLTDGDKGHIVVSASGTVWLWDTTVAVTGAQTITTTGQFTLTSGEDFFTDAVNDLVLNAGSTAGGLSLHAGLTPKTGANNNRVTISADDQVVIEPTGSFRVFTNAVERLEIENDGAWQLSGVTGTSGQVFTSGGSAAPPSWTTIAGLTDGDKGDITVSSTGTVWTVDANIAKTWTGNHAFAGRMVWDGIFATTLAAQANDLAIGAVNVVRITLTGSQLLTGMVPSADNQVVYLENVDATDTLTIEHGSSSSTAANTFVCPGEVDLVMPPRSAVLCRYDATSDRWFIALAPESGRLLVVTVLAAGASGTHIFNALTRTVIAEFWGGGSGGYGCAAASASEIITCSGGAGGGYGRAIATGFTANSCTYSVGTGGSGGAATSPSNPGDGTATTVTLDGEDATAGGGTSPSATAMASGITAAFSAGESTGGAIGGVTGAPWSLLYGAPGEGGDLALRLSGSSARSGRGGAAGDGGPGGPFRTSGGAGTAGSAPGAAGAGASSHGGTAQAGGAGFGGQLIIYEYS